MQCYAEIAPPTAVSHAVHLPFVSPRAHNLVVAKNSLLQVFELRSTAETAYDDATNAGNAGPLLDTEVVDVPLLRTENTAKLVLVAEAPLAGTVVSLARVKALNTKTRAEVLLVAFRDAKLSLVEWDPETYSLHTISIHYYENPDLPGVTPWSPDLKDTRNFLTADPGSRCAALKFGTHNLAILPFRQRDLVEDEYDSDHEGPKDAAMADANAASAGDAPKTPYAASFVLPLTHLDPTLTHPVHLAFLYEYREPTFGVIASSKAAAVPLLPERRDILTYTVFTLDLEQKASTTLLSIQGLPYDINRVVPLPLPIGGALLVGSNAIVHVDQAGRTNGVAVNEFAKASTSFQLNDQSDLAVHLEGCAVELLSPDSGDVLIVLNDGKLLTLTFTLDGRTVSGLALQRVAADNGGHLLNVAPSCISNLGRGRLFVGSEDGESVLLGWTNKSASLGRKQSQAGQNDDEMSVDEEVEEDDLDDDLYNDTAPAVQKITAAAAEPTAPGSYTFKVHDVLPSIAPIRDTIVHGGAAGEHPTAGEIMVSSGRGAAGAITALNRLVHPTHLAQSDFGSARGLWAVHARKQGPAGVTASFGEDVEASMSSDAEYDQYLVVCKADADGNEKTTVYEVAGKDLEETTKGDFERDEGSTLNVGVLANGMMVVQIMRGEVRTYDSELNMVEMLPMEDENGEEVHILNASFADPYLLILRADSTVKILRAISNDELEEVDASGLSSTKWLSASLFKSPSINETFAFLLTPEGGLHVFSLSNMEKPSFVAEGLCFLPPILTGDYYARRSTAKAAITEILAADIGDTTARSPHLVVRTSTDDLVIYKAFHHPIKASDPWTKNLRWVKLSQQHLPKYTDELAGSEDPGRDGMLVALDNVCGYSTVFLRGTSPAFILKESSSAPRVIGLHGKAVKSLTRFHTSACQRGFAYLDAQDTLRISLLPSQTHYGHLGWAAHRMPIGSEVHAFAYHPKGLYVLGTGQSEEFMLQDDTYHWEWKPEDINFKPHVERGLLKVIDEKTWSVLDTHVLDPLEVVLCIKTLNLEVSENTHERRQVIAVGTSIVVGEDLATKGCIRIFEVITVVPDPDRPETNRKLRLIVKDEVKGAVSAISELGTQGFMIMAQGQKCMVRGLKEDGTLLPVAFMDMQCYVTVLKTLPNSGMLLMGDAFKGLWFTGYTEEPYKMILFGRSKNNLEVLSAEFLPFEKQLHLIAADADMNLQVLQFDPENPKSMGGLRLLHRATFHTGHFPVTTHLVQSRMHMPSTAEFPSSLMPEPNGHDDEAATPLHQVLLTTQSGSLALLTPLSESSYRRLSGLTTFLANSLESACGLNPRAWRAVEGEVGGVGAGARGVLDGNLLMRWGELGVGRQREGFGKVGGDEWAFWGEREVIAGWGVFGQRG